MKKRIGITQRVMYLPKIRERRDVLDQRWMAFAKVIDVSLIPLPNIREDVTDYVNELNIEGFIFSGGNNIGYISGNKIPNLSIEKDDVAYERDETEHRLLKWAHEKKRPVIGVCRGMQFISSFYGGNLTIVDRNTHVAKRHPIQVTTSDFSKFYGDNAEVNSYHGYGINQCNLPDELASAAMFNEQVEAFKDKNQLFYGIMWHPEREEVFSTADICFFTKILNNEA